MAATVPSAASHLGDDPTELHTRMHGRVLALAENPLAYGCVGDGATDDTAAWNDMVAALVDGTTIVIPNGYTFSLINPAHIVGLDGITLLGMGGVLKQGATRLLTFETCTNLRILNTECDMNGISAFGGISISESVGVQIIGNHFYDTGEHGTASDIYGPFFTGGSFPSTDIVVANNHFEALQLEIDHTNRVKVYGNTILRPRQTAGIGFFSQNDSFECIDVDVFDNYVFDPNPGTGAAIAFLQDPAATDSCTWRRIKVHDNTMVHTGTNTARSMQFGTLTIGTATTGNVWEDIEVYNNLMVNLGSGVPSEAGMCFFASSPTAAFEFVGVRISGNHAIGNASSGGFVIREASGVEATGNYFEGLGFGFASDGTDQIRYDNNRFHNLDTPGVAIQNTGTTDACYGSGNLLTGTVPTVPYAITAPQAFETDVYMASTDWTPGSIADDDVASVFITLPGAEVGDTITTSLDSMPSGRFMLSGHVVGSDTVRIVLLNKTGAPGSVAAGTLTTVARRYAPTADSGQIAFSPLLINGIQGWWKADSLVLSDNDPVSTWADDAGANDVTQTGSNRPTYKTNIQNSLPVVRFAAASTQWMATAGSPVLPESTGPISVFFVAARGTGNPRRVMGHQSGIAGWTAGVGGAADTASFVTINVQDYAFAGEWPSASTFYCFAYLLDSSQDVTLYRDGVSIGTVAHNAFGADPGTSPFEIGSMNTGTELWNGDIGEIVLVDGTIGTSDRDDLTTYLMDKWGI